MSPATYVLAALIITLSACGATLCLFAWRGATRVAELEGQLAADRALRARTDQALIDAHEVLCRLVRQQEHVRDGERSRIARDIHDDLGQTLLALRAELLLLQVAANGIHPSVHQKVGAMVVTLDLAIRSLRAIVHDLRPLALGEGLRVAFERQVRDFARLNGIECHFDASPGAFDGPSRTRAVDAMLYRTLQESLSNVARHAQATEVRVTLTRHDDCLHLRVQDNGVGITPQQASCGTGLAGMRERVAAAGGVLDIEAAAHDAGTVVSLQVPLAGEHGNHLTQQ